MEIDNINIFDSVVFDDKSYGAILRDIYQNRDVRNDQINGLIDSLKYMMKKPADAVVLIPFMKEYLEIAVKNDENVVKLASIIQRSLTKVGNDGKSNWFNDDELKDLTANMPPEDKQELLDVINTHNNIEEKIKKVNDIQQSAEELLAELEDK